MRFVHAAHPGRAVLLSYCLNLHASDTLAGVRAGIREVTLPLRDRLARGRPFGVGAYLPAGVARELAAASGLLDGFTRWLADEGLAAFTFNAFPFGGFHSDGLKAGVYSPAWDQPERLAYTLDVAAVAAACHSRSPDPSGHVSISTHAGGYGAWSTGPGSLHEYSRGFASAAVGLARIASRGGPQIVLALEPEPESSATDTAQLAEFLIVARTRAARAIAEAGLAEPGGAAAAAAALHLGTCLDACHSAVEFESPERAVERATLGGALGKLQFSSALELAAPAEHPDARAALLALDEPRYLHQVVGRAPEGRVRASDLGDLARGLESSREAWLACDAWRCHFHVPVDLASTLGLGTTRAAADAVLEAALHTPDGWGTEDLHVEIETYTWDVLPAPARGAGGLVDGLEREYEHVLGRLQAAGWHPPTR